MADAKKKTEVISKEVTPYLSKDVSFTQKVEDVDSALKNRARANKDIKLKYANLIKLFAKYNVQLGIRRLDAPAIQNYVNAIRVFYPQDPRLEDTTKLNHAKQVSYELKRLVEKRTFMSAAEVKFKGINAWFNEFIELFELSQEPRVVDEKATTKAKAELQKAVDTYIEALEAYDDTVTTVANVKEYIGVVKDVAEISALAQGMVPKQDKSKGSI